MQEFSFPKRAELKKEIHQLSSSLDNLISQISELNLNGIDENLWNLRADLEMLIVKIKLLLEKGNGSERWQKDFLEKLKGTKIQEKACDILMDTVMDSENTMIIFEKNLNEIYQYFWKLKEVISSVIPAFQKRELSEYLNNDVEKEIFEI